MTASGKYQIKESQGLLTPPEARPLLFKSSTIITWSLWSAYIAYEYVIVSKLHLWQTWTLFCAEIFLALQGIVSAVNTLYGLSHATSENIRPSLKLIGQSVPTIDVFVTCCGEAVDIIMDTITAAARQDYPSHSFRILVLDDGKDQNLKNEIEKFIQQESEPKVEIIYVSRELKPGQKSHFKAGNLLNGINFSSKNPKGPSQFIASLDADMICDEDWLRKTVPHLLLDDNLAMACPPQRYYNVPESDPLGQQAELDIVFAFCEPLDDGLDAAMCTGTGYVARRKALMDVGGWPLVNVGEDFMCSAMLSSVGWKNAFIREQLQSGLAPSSFRAHLKQRKAWVDSAIIVHKAFGFYLPGAKLSSTLSFKQRVVGIIQLVREYTPVTTFFAIISLPLILLPSGADSILYGATYDNLNSLKFLYLISFIAHKINDRIIYGSLGERRVANFFSMDIWCSPYNASRCLLSIIPSAADLITFESSGSVVSPINERDAKRRKPLLGRLFNVDIAWSFGYLLFAMVAISTRLVDYGWFHTASRQTLFPFPGAIMKTADCAWKAATPFLYMLSPPTVPERRLLMEKDGNGTWRPKKTRMHRGPSDVMWLLRLIIEATIILCLF